MNTSTIALILFVILCPCISYIIVRRKIIPWNGGVFLVMEDDSLIPIKWGQYDSSLPSSAVIKGLFLAGAHANMMPKASFRLISRTAQEHLIKDMYHYRLVEDDQGVFQFYCTPLQGEDLSMVVLDVSAPYPWKGWGKHHGQAGYYKHICIHFDEKASKVLELKPRH
jgi:hypothetical protein